MVTRLRMKNWKFTRKMDRHGANAEMDESIFKFSHFLGRGNFFCKMHQVPSKTGYTLSFSLHLSLNDVILGAFFLVLP